MQSTTGDEFALTYDGDVVDTVTDSDGRTITYGYEDGTAASSGDI
jgi:hypothetical protein